MTFINGKMKFGVDVLMVFYLEGDIYQQKTLWCDGDLLYLG